MWPTSEGGRYREEVAFKMLKWSLSSKLTSRFSIFFSNPSIYSSTPFPPPRTHPKKITGKKHGNGTNPLCRSEFFAKTFKFKNQPFKPIHPPSPFPHVSSKPTALNRHSQKPFFASEKSVVVSSNLNLHLNCGLV